MRELTKRENWRKYWRSSSSLSGKRKILGELERVEGGIGQEETAVKVLREQWRRERELEGRIEEKAATRSFEGDSEKKDE